MIWWICWLFCAWVRTGSLELRDECTRSLSPPLTRSLSSFRAYVIPFAKRFLLLLLNVKNWFDLQLNVKRTNPNEIKQFSIYGPAHGKFCCIQIGRMRSERDGEHAFVYRCILFLFVEVEKKSRTQAQHLYLVNICLIIMECWKLITRRFSAVNVRVCVCNVHTAYLSSSHWEKLCARLQKKNTKPRLRLPLRRFEKKPKN